MIVSSWRRGLFTVAGLARGLAWVNRAAIPLIVGSIVLYGLLLRYNDYQAHRDEAWGYLGAIGDQTLILDSAARVLATGTFAQFDGTYARVTGLAGYGLGLLAMAVGGLYPGYAWLRLWLIGIGALLPLMGFFVIRLALGNVVAAAGVALLLANEPLLITESRTIYHDVPTTVLAGASLMLLYRLLREDRPRPRLAAWLGVMTGLTILAKMSHMCFVAVIIGSAALRRWTWARWKNVGVALCVAGLVIGVWVGRNAKILGTPMLSSQAGLSFVSGTGQHISKPPGAGGEIATVGQEQRFNQAYMRQAFTWIAHHPREYVRHVVKKFSDFWLKGPSPWWRWLLWGLVASLAVLLLWERRLFSAMIPIGLYLLLYTTTFSVVWPAIPTYYPPFTFLVILMIAPAIAGTVGRVWRGICQITNSLGGSPAVVRGIATLCCVGMGIGPLTTAWRTARASQCQAAENRAFLTWSETVLPPEAVILKTHLGDPWEVQQYTQRPVVFNVLNGMPWVIYKTPYGWRDYRQDYESIDRHPTAFRFDRQRDHGTVDAAVYLEPAWREAVWKEEGIRQLLAVWRTRGRDLFVLDTDATPLAQTFLPLNGYPLRGDELGLKFFRAFPYNPHRTIYRLIPHDDPRFAQFGPGMEEAVVWQTAPSPWRQGTTVQFMGAFGRHPGMAKLLVNGTYALSFRLGSDSDGVWVENGYHFAYQRQRPWWEMKGHPQYSIGVFTLTVPAHAAIAGQPLTLSISPLLVSGDPECWFAVLDVHQREGFTTLVGASEVWRNMDDGQSGHADMWVARSEPARF